MASVSGIGIEKVELVDQFAFHDTSGIADSCGDITDVALVGAVSVFVGYPTCFQAPLVFAYHVPVSGEIGRDAIVEILDIIFPAQCKFQTGVRNLTEILVRC